MNCEVCGKEFRPSGRGSANKYCSGACRAKAYRRRRKNGEIAAVPKPAAKKESPRANAESAVLDRRSFERMMDEPLEDVLRRQRDRLQAAMDDPGTPANALAGISRQLISICERLDSMAGDSGLFDSEDETMEVTDDVGASIV